MDERSVEKIVLEFLETTVCNQGRISIQNLTGHFSQLPVDIRKRFNCTKTEVKKFLLTYPELFVVNEEIVSLSPKKDPPNLVDCSVQSEDLMPVDVEDSNDDEATEKIMQLFDCKGRVIKKFDVYGFIEYSSPALKTNIYFDVSCFEDGQNYTFGKVNLNEEVNFHAKRSFGHKAQYRATKVWRCSYPMSLQGSDKCYSSSTSLASQDSYQSDALNGTGIVVKITANYGFIKPTGKVKGNVFFFRTRLHLPGVQEIKTLEDVLQRGDVVYFSAVQSRKKNADVPWEATNVSKTLVENSCNGLPKLCSKNSMLRTGSTSSTDCSFASSGLDSDRVIDENHIYDQDGSIQNISSNEPVIQFDKNKVATVPPNVVYINNKLVEEPGWELDEDQNVRFNAEYINSNWRATLVWIGEKPSFATNKKSHKKKNTQIKESTVSDLCQISLYDDDQSDDGIWHASSHIDTNTWDEENSENWPALEPPLSPKKKSMDKIKLSEYNTKVPKSEVINTIPRKNEEKHNNGNDTDGCKENIITSNSKKSHKKKNAFDTASYATIVAAPSNYCQQTQTDSNSEVERLKRYKINNGWEDSSFNSNSEKWPALSEPLIIKPVGNDRKDKGRLHGRFIPRDRIGDVEYDPANELMFSYCSDDDLSSDKTSSDIPYDKSLTVTDSHPLNSQPQKAKSNKFSDITGMVTGIQKHFAFIKYDETDQNLIFFWEQAFCDGLFVPEYFTDLHEAFNELDHVNFTYCHMIGENGREWTRVLQVWKGEKPLQLSVEDAKQHPQLDAEIGSFNTAIKETAPIYPAESIHTNSSAMILPTVNAFPNKNSTEDIRILLEEAETHKPENNSKPIGLPTDSISPLTNASASQHKGEEIEVEEESYEPSTASSDLSASELRTVSESSQKEKITSHAISNFLNNVLGLTPSTKLEPSCSKEVTPHILSDDTCVSSRNKETQTEVTAREEGTQTFITGPVLSVAVFPQ